MKAQEPTKLKKLITERFGHEGFCTLAFDIGASIEDLPSDLASLTRELIDYYRHQLIKNYLLDEILWLRTQLPYWFNFQAEKTGGFQARVNT
jgi:hypothetical protein